jgi:hypothetical protein
MANTITVQLTVAEAWAVLDALAEANRNFPDKLSHGDKFEPQMRTWIADRVLRKLNDPARVEN